jgi:aspartate aminotransferase
MFESVALAPPDPILGISEAFNRDERPTKINLSVGVFKDASGATPVLASVKEAEKRLLASEKTKGYKPIDGDPLYGRAVRELLFGKDSVLVAAGGRAATCHTPGGTGGLRLAADFLATKAGAKRIWMSDPTWENHQAIFRAAGFDVEKYGYYSAATHGLDFVQMKESLGQVKPGDVVLLHACCHNPTGVDPSTAQWGEIAELLSQKGALPLVDFAYQGFGAGLEEDAQSVRILEQKFDELLVCSSFSKNFGLYNERTGALTLKARTPEACTASLSQLKICARVNYSNPPAHGGAIVQTILTDADLRKQWEAEVTDMRARIQSMRDAFVEGLARAGTTQDFSFIQQQKGMFSFSGLSKDQVERLKAEFGIYIVGSGRLNVAGMTANNMPALCQAVAAVL